MAKRTKAQALATRNRILNTAERVFEKKGVSRTTLEDIARAARVTRGAIYFHFRNKAHLVADMFSRIILPTYTFYPEDLDAGPDPLGHLREMLVFILKQISCESHHRRVLNIIHHKCETTGDMRVIVARYRSETHKVRGLLVAAMKQAIDRGQLPASLNVARAETMFDAVLAGLVHNWTLTPTNFDLNSEAEALVDTLIDMLRLSPTLRSEGSTRAG